MADIIEPISFPSSEHHPKKWGAEDWLINNGRYCAKFLTFVKGEHFSTHYHWIKEETWIVIDGVLELLYCDLSDANWHKKELKVGDIVHIPPGNPHKLVALTNAKILEVSTPHYEADSYRIGKGSSQL